MRLEWLLLVLGAAAGLAIWLRLLGRGRGPRWQRALGVLAVILTLLAGTGWERRGRRSEAAAAAVRADMPAEGRPGGFVSSSTCRACHPAQYASWHRSYHRTMTQYATPATVKAAFEGLPPMRVRGGHIQLERQGESYWMLSRLGQDPVVQKEYRIGLITGSHHLQSFWVADGRGNHLEMVPYSFLLTEQRWVPARDTFLADPRIPFRFDTWNTQCLRCHVTGGQPRPFPDGSGLASRAAEIGIGCESCHGPGEEHVRQNANPLRRYRLALAGTGDPTIVNPRRLPPRASAETCGQCHGLSGIADFQAFLESGIGFRPGDSLPRWKPPIIPGDPASEKYVQAALAEDPHFIESRFWPDGVARIIGREWAAMSRSRCHLQGGMTCLSCHSMHDSDPDDQLARGRAGDEACLQCHQALRPRVAEHTHHQPGSEGSRCYNCHMANTTYGLLKATRSHFIERPRAAETLEAGRPNACNLCHLDRTLLWTAERLHQWYGQPLPEKMTEAERTVASAVVLGLRGDAAQRALIHWAMGWAPAQQASGTDWLAGYLTLGLGDTYSAVRLIAERSLRGLPGFQDIEYDYVATPEEIERSLGPVIARWAKLRRPVPEPERAARLLMHADGGLDSARVGSLVARRNERLLELKE
jgi:predicted CXXCH cytochrome family protein